MDQRASRLESYAFRRSIKHMYRGQWNSFAFSITFAKGKQVTGTTPSTAKATLALTQKEFGSGFHRFRMAYVKTLLGVLRRAMPR